MNNVRSMYEQEKMHQFLERIQKTDKFFLGIKKDSDGQWLWDDGEPVFVQCKWKLKLLLTETATNIHYNLVNSWTDKVTVKAGSTYNDANSYPVERAVDSLLDSDGFFATRNSKRWIEVTLTETILIKTVRVFTYTVSKEMCYLTNVKGDLLHFFPFRAQAMCTLDTWMLGLEQMPLL